MRAGMGWKAIVPMAASCVLRKGEVMLCQVLRRLDRKATPTDPGSRGRVSERKEVRRPVSSAPKPLKLS